MSLRIGILHYTCPPIVGGVEQLMAIHARLLLAHGHQVVVLAGRGGAAVSGVAMRRLPLLDSKHPQVVQIGEVLADGLVPSELEALAANIEGALREQMADLDVCIVHNALTLHFNMPLTVALGRLAEGGLSPPRLVAWCHDLAWSNSLYLPILRDAWPWSLLKSALPGIRYVVVSEDRRADLSRLSGLPPREISVIPAGVSPARKLALGATVAWLVERFDLLRADPFLLLPVRITKRKNIEYALRVVAHLRDDYGLRPRLVVTGPPGPHNPRSGDYVSELRRLRRDLDLERDRSALFLFEERDAAGRRLRVSDRSMDDLYRAADLLLFPSTQEGFGIPMLEAGMASLPIFCADIPPFREIAGEAAHYFALDDPPAHTAGRIATYCREAPSYRLRKRVVADYAWESLYLGRIAPLLEAGAPAPAEVVA